MIYFMFVQQREQEPGGFTQWETLRCVDTENIWQVLPVLDSPYCLSKL